MTAALERGEWSEARPGRTLPPRENRYPFYKRLGEPQGRSERAENLVPTAIRSRTVQYNGHRVFPGGKERPGRDADPSPPSSAVVKKE